VVSPSSQDRRPAALESAAQRELVVEHWTSPGSYTGSEWPPHRLRVLPAGGI